MAATSTTPTKEQISPMLLSSDEPAGANRKRKIHKKSRAGCRNCKLRRVKCDEIRPACQKCTSFRVVCNYNSSIPDLQIVPHGSGASTSMIPKRQQYLPGISLPSPTDEPTFSVVSKSPALPYPVISDGLAMFQLDRDSLERLDRFQARTVLTIGSPKGAKLFQKIALEMACSSPYLMHVVQTLTAIHDRYLSKPSRPRKTLFETYHLSRAASLFAAKLSSPVLLNHERDGIWGATVLMGVIAFTTIEAATPEEAWPLGDPDPSDLEWIRMSESKMAVWQLAQPYREGSVYFPLRDEMASVDGGESKCSPNPGELEDIPSGIIQLCGINQFSTPENNAYLNFCLSLFPLFAMEYERATAVMFLRVWAHLSDEFKKLLYRKDSRAMLLLAYWHAKLVRSVWWLERRARLEGMAICLFLERYHGGEADMMELVRWPKLMCGNKEW